jgi:hypothetical protein
MIREPQKPHVQDTHETRQGEMIYLLGRIGLSGIQCHLVMTKSHAANLGCP